MSRLYVPSGKYPPYAPVVFILALLITTGASGFIYGYYNSEYIILFNNIHDELPGINLVIIPNVFGLMIIFNSWVVLRLIVALKIRNPALARRWTLWTSMIGWSLLNWLGLYIASGSDLGIFQFMADRLAYGVQGVIPQRSGSKVPMYVWLNGYVLFIGWVLEAGVMPLWLGIWWAWVFAGRPFSEKTMSWYKWPIKLPFRVYQPSSKEIRQKISNVDYGWIEYARPSLYDKNTGEVSFIILFPKHHKDSIYYALQFNVKTIFFCWDITIEQAEMLISKFDPKKKTKAPKLLNKYKQENEADLM